MTEDLPIPERVVRWLAVMGAIIFALSLLTTYLFARNSYPYFERDKYLIDKFFEAYPDCDTTNAHVKGANELHLSCFGEDDLKQDKRKNRKRSNA